MSKPRRAVVRMQLPGFVTPEPLELPPELVERLRTPTRLDHFSPLKTVAAAHGEALARYCDLLKACGMSTTSVGADNIVPLHRLLALSYPGLRVEWLASTPGAKPSMDAMDVFKLVVKMGQEAEKGTVRYESRVCRGFAKERGLNDKTVRDIWIEVKSVMSAEADPDRLTSVQLAYLLAVEPIIRGKHAPADQLMARYRSRFAVAADIKSAN